MTSQPRTRLTIFILLLLALLPAVPPAQRAALAATPTPVLITPPIVEQSLGLGQHTTIAVQVSNPSTETLELRVFEAYAASAEGREAHSEGPTRVALPAQAERIDPLIWQAQREASDGQAQFVVYLAEQADMSAAYAAPDWASRGRIVVETLRAQAETSQRELRALLRARGMAFEPLWVVNALVARGDAADVHAIGARAEVALLRARRTFSIDAPIAEPHATPGLAAAPRNCAPDSAAPDVCWNIRKIGADRVWRELGVRGQGVTLGSIDTGVMGEHPALRGQYRGYRGAEPPSHDYNWYDPRGFYATPTDDAGHGTHTLGTMVGLGFGSPEQPAVGVAPGATWVAAKGCMGSTCAESDLIKSAQWLLAPTDAQGTNPRPDLRPMIVNNSWGTPTRRDIYAGYVAAWRAAGMFPVFANGNDTAQSSDACGNVLAPGDYANVVGVGATDSFDQVASYSRRGPTSDGRMKPDFAAPGSGIASTWNSGDYQSSSGTSMATPHVAGAVALLWSANPSLVGDYDETYRLLKQSALHLSDSRCGGVAGQPNNIYGNGRIDVYAAVTAARVDLPWVTPQAASLRLLPGATAPLSLTLDGRRVTGPGLYTGRILLSADLGQAPAELTVRLNVTPIAGQATLRGVLRDSLSGAPLAGQVEVEDGPSITTDTSGAYSLTLPTGSLLLTATARSYIPASLLLDLQRDTTRSFLLDPDEPRIEAPTGPLTGTVDLVAAQTISLTLRNSGSQALIYTAFISGTSGLALLPSPAGTLAPGASTALQVQIQPYSGLQQAARTSCETYEQRHFTLWLRSNDPRRAELSVPIVALRELPGGCAFLPLALTR
jgi:subtilisin family serine protease